MASISKTVRPKRSNNNAVSPTGYGLTVGRGTPAVGGTGTATPAEAPAWVNSGNLQTDNPFNDAEGAGSSVAGWGYEAGWNLTTPASGKYTCRTQVVDATAPRSASTVARSWLKAGMHDDDDLGLASANFRDDSYYTSVPIYEKVFMTMWFRLSANWVPQASAGGHKLTWLPANYGNSNANWFIWCDVIGGSQLQFGIVDNAQGQFGGDSHGARTRTTVVTVNRGDWVRISLESRASHYAVADGSVNLWVNGTSQGEATTGLVKHSPTAGVAKANIHGIRTCGYFGGAASTTLAVDQYIDLDHFTMWGSD